MSFSVNVKCFLNPCCPFFKKRKLAKLKTIKYYTGLYIKLKEYKKRVDSVFTMSLYDEDYVSLAFRGDEKDFLKVKNYINGYTPYEYLKIDNKEELEDFKWMLAAYNDKHETLIVTEENVMEEVVNFMNNSLSYSFFIDAPETRIAFSRGSEVNGYSVVWMDSYNMIRYASFMS